jgi:hypothetical protein
MGFYLNRVGIDPEQRPGQNLGEHISLLIVDCNTP